MYLLNTVNFHSDDLLEAARRGWPEAMGMIALDMLRPRTAGEFRKLPDDLARAYAFRSAYSNSRDGMKALHLAYLNGERGFKKDPFRAVVWGYAMRLHDAEQEGIGYVAEDDYPAKLSLTEDELRSARRHAELVFLNYRAAYQKRLEEERPRWDALTRALHAELDELFRALPPAKRR